MIARAPVSTPVPPAVTTRAIRLSSDVLIQLSSRSRPGIGHIANSAGANVNAAPRTNTTPKAPNAPSSCAASMRTVAIPRKPIAVVRPENAMGLQTACSAA